MTTWNKVKFSDCLSNVVDNRGKTCPTAKTGIPLIATNCIKNDSLYPVFENIRYVSKETYDTWFRDHPKPGDMLFVLKGSPGRVCWTPDPINFCIAQDMLAIRANENIVNSKFLFALLRTQEVQQLIENLHVGSLIPHFKKGDFDQLILTIPDDKEFQKQIGDIYFNLCNKVEINRQVNRTLEQMAKGLFEKYFIDDIDPKNLPEGWKAARLSEEIEVKHGYAYSGKDFSDEETSDILLTPGNFRIGGGFNYNKFKYFKAESPKEYILHAEDLVITMTDLSKDGDTLGYSALVPTISNKRLLHNQRIGKVIFKNNPKLKFYLYWLMRTSDYRAFIVGSATGTTVKHTSPTRICEYQSIIPSHEALLKFEKDVQPFHQMEISNNIEIEAISKLRDSLLPKLMNGEIKIKDIETIAA